MFNATLAGSSAMVMCAIFIVFCFYFTLCFFEYLRKEDDRAAKQSKISAVICLAAAVSVPVLYNIYFYNLIMGD